MSKAVIEMSIVSTADLELGAAFALCMAACAFEPQARDENASNEDAPAPVAAIGDDLADARPMLRPMPAPPPDAVATDSGVKLSVVQPGTAASYHPDPSSSVCLHYEARTLDGRLIESTYRRGSPKCSSMMDLPPGVREGVTYMTVGEKTRMWIPSRLALMHYRGPSDEPLVYDVELLQILASQPRRHLPVNTADRFSM